MENESEYSSEETLITEERSILEKIFLNLFISSFIIIVYFTISESFGSISTAHVNTSGLSITFGTTLLVFSFLSVLAGPFQALACGCIGEYLYQLAFYNSVQFQWVMIVGIIGGSCGIYKYKPMKYFKKKNLACTITTLLSSMAFGSILLIFLIGFNVGISFFITSLLSVVLPVPILLFLYDKAFSKEPRAIYHELFTHHPATQDDHTFYLDFGRTRIYFCTRCSGIIYGGIIAFFWTHLYEVILDTQFNQDLALILIILLPIPGLADWGTQRLMLRKSTTRSRLFTGFIIGHALRFLSFARDFLAITTFIVILYFSIFFGLMFLGYKRELKQYREEMKQWAPDFEPESMISEVGDNEDQREMKNILFIHGLESSGQGPKAQLLRKRIPEIITPTFKKHLPGMNYKELLKERMDQLESILSRRDHWILIGSSFGGLMATLYAFNHPDKIQKLILLAPYLTTEELDPRKVNAPINIPVTIFHSKLDRIVPMEPTFSRAKMLFSNLNHKIIEDDEHRLQLTAERLDWDNLI